jgi:hypothetical protein
MPLKAVVCLAMALLISSAAAIITEDSASANALSGITLLSWSVSDFALSPTIPATGIAFSCHFPYSVPECGVYSLNTATSLNPFIVSAGISYLDQGDYRVQDLHLGMAFHYNSLSIGYAEHLLYEKVSTGNSYHTWNGNLSLSYRGDTYGTEIRLMHPGAEDAELNLSASTRVAQGVNCASTYIYSPHEEDSYRVATAIEIGEPILLMASWQSNPARFGAGLKFRYKAGEITYGIRTHTDLKLSHSLDLGFTW